MASRRHIILGKRTMSPGQSSLSIFFQKLSALRSGSLIARRTTAEAINVGTPIMGLIAKHHRHDALVTRAPPSGGPNTVDPTVKTLTAAFTTGLCRRGKAYAIILRRIG
jgi:hypothetical protein